MPRFDLDQQRALVCLFGLVALTVEGVAFYLTEKALPDIFTGAFISMAVGPIVGKWGEAIRDEKRSRQEQARQEEEAKSTPTQSPPEGGSE